MFKSFSIKYKEFKNNKYHYDTTIVDDDFEETIAVVDVATRGAIIIEIYSKRNLNVAKNLYLFMKSNEGNWKIQDQIKYYKTNVQEFEKYLPEINKYLALE